ncbi:LacI family DNA-binding transcriptional regulator [Promicromonospora thailandica]|nr:LacI family DNA-binding transcriptional regulator [Promicromonospora thailandica]BFF17498.1 LacI family DNA-binding transcriptional regulator [Promicromonospora thailandica]
MPATMKEVATRAGVSLKTVSRVVNREPHIRPETMARVEAAIAELGWVPNPSARNLRTGRTGTIGIVVAELRRPYLAMLVEALVHEAERLGLTATVEPTHRRPRRISEVLGERGHLYDGVLLIDPEDLEPVMWDQAQQPVVVIQGGSWQAPVDRVDEDVVEAAGLVARHLGVMGRTRPVLLGPDRARTETDRENLSAALRAALSAVGIEAGAVPRVSLGGVGDRRAGARAAAAALEVRPDLDALLCVNDEVAIGALSCLVERGVAVPDDVAIIGYDNLADGQFSTPTLTTIDPSPAGLARAALELLMDRVRGGAPAAARQATVPVTLVRRESTMGMP